MRYGSVAIASTASNAAITVVSNWFDRLREPETGDSARHRVAVRAVGRHRVVGISNGDDP